MDAAEAMVPIFGIVFTFGIPGVLIFWWIYTKHRERMRLIEKGLAPEDVKKYFAEAEIKAKSPFSALKWGILLLSLGLGIFTGNMLENIYDLNEGVVFGTIVIFLGVGFVVYYAIVSSKMKSIQGNNQSVINN